MLFCIKLVLICVFHLLVLWHKSKSDDEFIAINDTRVLGVCSRPNLPPKARIRFVSPEKVKFAENETIYILCEENQFPHHVQNRTCRHGQWHGPHARCGKSVSSNVVKINAYGCSQPQKSLLSLDLNQTDETPYPLPPNSFHFTRVNDDTVLSVFGWNCYRWFVQFDKKIEIAFLLIDINLVKVNGVKEMPKISVNIKHRTCKLQHTSYQMIDQDEIFGNYFFCDLDLDNLSSMTNDDERLKTDKLIVDIRTSTNRTVGLEAVFVGETYKKQLKLSGSKKLLTADCGKLEIQRTGVLEQVELGHVKLSCNDSFINADGIGKKHKFVCDANGIWQGDWPTCIPKKSCSKQEIAGDLDSSITIERIGNVYYTNMTNWVAIDHSWVHYACASFDGIMVGKNERVCRSGKWTNKKPHCTQAIQAGSTSLTIIITILAILMIAFSLIIYLFIKFHTKKIHRKLESTKNELEANALNKQISQEYYTDIGLETIYEDCKEIYSSPMYEMAEDVRYDIEPRAVAYEPEYLTMTEGLSKDTPPKLQGDTYIYSN